jgi:transcriptional regulator with PAS, ATPase and Fis domain
VLIEGESGVGKELVARQVHALSRRARGPFVAVNCAALVETLFEAELFGIEERTATGVRGRRGKFELADGGTLFLDEIADLSAASQAKLLRALQDMMIERVGGHLPQKVDVRVIAATNRSLHELVESGGFRPDLYYRLNCVEVHVPPLRERRSDIPELVRYFLTRHGEGRDIGVAHEALEALLDYRWPGNVRELERAVQRAVALAESDCIQLHDLPPKVTGGYREVLHPSLEAGDDMRTWQARYARLVLNRCSNNKREACRSLGVSYHTLQAYLRRSLPTAAAGGDAAPAAGGVEPAGRPGCLDRSDGA